jgi:hypothetical protein
VVATPAGRPRVTQVFRHWRPAPARACSPAPPLAGPNGPIGDLPNRITLMAGEYSPEKHRGAMVDEVGFGLVLDRVQCLTLLRKAAVGRVVYTHRAMPAVRPVRFTLVGEAVVFAVPDGSPLYAGARDAVVAFEADEFDVEPGTGWFVSVLGRATEFPDAEVVEIACLCRCPSRAGRRFLQIPVETVTGHRMACSAG